MAIADKLAYLGDTKQIIRQALEGVGEYISDSDTFREYTAKLANSQRTLGLNFSEQSYDILTPRNSKVFPDLLTFTRASLATAVNRLGELGTNGVDVERISHDASATNQAVETVDISEMSEGDVTILTMVETNTYSVDDAIVVNDSFDNSVYFYARVVEVDGDVLTCVVTDLGYPTICDCGFIIKSEGLLIEEQRTNLLLWSEDFSNAAWTKANCALSTGQNGGTVITGSGSFPRIVQTPALSDNENVTETLVVSELSAWVFRFQFTDKSGAVNIVRFNLREKTVQAGENVSNPKLKSLGAGVYEASATFNAASGSTTPELRVVSNESVVSPGGWADENALVIYRVQLEQGSSPTSYIKTEGSQVTREADNCSRTLGDEFNAYGFTLYWEFNSRSSGNLGGIADGGDRYIALNSSSGDLSQIRILARSSSWILANEWLSEDLPEGAHRVALSVSPAGWLACLDGATPIAGPEDLTVIAEQATVLYQGREPQNNFRLNGTIGGSFLLPRPCTAAELEALTAPEVN